MENFSYRLRRTFPLGLRCQQLLRHYVVRFSADAAVVRSCIVQRALHPATSSSSATGACEWSVLARQCPTTWRNSPAGGWAAADDQNTCPHSHCHRRRMRMWKCCHAVNYANWCSLAASRNCKAIRNPSASRDGDVGIKAI